VRQKAISAVFFVLLLISLSSAGAEPLWGIDSLYLLRDGETKQVNALWGENPKEVQFGGGRRKVVVADLKGPGVITMMHFALPQTMKLGRDLVLRIYWDGERYPSVESPLVDFFCDPNGALERVDTVLVNKKRGWNCYFPMPFRKSARVELEADNPRYPSGSWSANPCYSYVIYHTMKSLPDNTAYFHACWRQRTLLLGNEEYEVFRARGSGHFVGWNCTVRGVGSPNAGYPVDENVKFYVDGEEEPTIEWQGLEDSFGFSWGFPEQSNSFPYTGFQPWYNGAAAYRFTVNDRISFKKDLRMTVGFGKNEARFFFDEYSKQENLLEFSSVAYWYQTEPHLPFPRLPAARERRPKFITVQSNEAPAPGETLIVYCGNMAEEDAYLAEGWDYQLKKGYAFQGPQWPGPVNYCWADYDSLEFDITCPVGISGVMRMYLLDGDNFSGGRRQLLRVEDRTIGEFEGFQSGRWVEVPVSAQDTTDGRISVVIKNLKPGSNAVVSILKFKVE